MVTSSRRSYSTDFDDVLRTRKLLARLYKARIVWKTSQNVHFGALSERDEKAPLCLYPVICG